MFFAVAFALIQATGTQVKLDVQIRPFLEIYFAARARAGAPATPAEQLALASVDAVAIGCDSPERFREACASLPESIDRGGQTIQIRQAGLAIADRLIGVPETDRQTIVARQRAGLEAKKKDIDAAFARYPALFDWALESLGVAPRAMTIPVAVVSGMPAPGAATFRDAGGGVVSVVGVASLDGFDLVETVLHEALHAVDTLTAKDQTMLSTLRSALTDAGVAPRTAADCAHAVIFAQAAATVRHVADPAHVPVGARPGGPYSRMSKPARDTVDIWTDRCEGKVDAKTAVARIVAAAKGDPLR